MVLKKIFIMHLENEWKKTQLLEYYIIVRIDQY